MSPRIRRFPDLSMLKVGRLPLVSLLLLPILAANSAVAIPQSGRLAIAQTAGKLPDTVAASVTQEISKTFQVAAGKLKIVESSAQTWPDGCLGLPKKAEICTQAIVPGWRVGVTDGSQQYFYRTDSTGKTLRAEVQPASILPLAAAERVRAFAARDLKIAGDKLKITQSQPQVFDGCLGIFVPARMCAQISIPGWQAVVSDGQKSWLYHLDRAANRIAQNTTASSAIAPVEIGFERQVESDRKIVFETISSGDITGRTITTTLTTEGTVTQLITAPNIRSRPVVINRLVPQQVEKFLALVVRQQFPNFNRLTYLTSASVADVPTIVIQDARYRTSYTSTEIDKLPKSLKTIIAAWEKITKTKK